MTRIPVVLPKWEPTARNLQVLSAVCALGSDELAAGFLKISPRVVGQHVRLFIIGTPCVSRAQACWIWRDRLASHIVESE